LADDPDWEAVAVQAPAPVSCPGASVARYPGSAAAADSGDLVAHAADSGAAGDRGDHAAAADGAADWGAQKGAWAAAVAAAVGAAASADASSNRGGHTKDDPHSSVPNSRPD
jgi:hypothetical protein